METTTLVGTWRLLEWRAVHDHDRSGTTVTHPLGREVRGLLHYGADGRMSVLIAAEGRSPFATDDFLGGTEQERAAAFSGFIAYAGTYAVRDGAVTHTLEISSYPNWVGSDQVRFAVVRNDRLVLSTEPILTSGTKRTSELTWVKITDPSTQDVGR